MAVALTDARIEILDHVKSQVEELGQSVKAEANGRPDLLQLMRQRGVGR
jgi:hypothetical protein